MKIVCKYPLLRKVENVVWLPPKARILTVLPKGKFATLYALINKDKPKVPYTIVTLGTGFTPCRHMTFNHYITTFERFGAVYHVFSLGENIDPEDPSPKETSRSREYNDLADQLYQVFKEQCS